jgi:hypothetical protein
VGDAKLEGSGLKAIDRGRGKVIRGGWLDLGTAIRTVSGSSSVRSWTAVADSRQAPIARFAHAAGTQALESVVISVASDACTRLSWGFWLERAKGIEPYDQLGRLRLPRC